MMIKKFHIKFHLQGSYHQIMVSVTLIFWNSKEQKLMYLICEIHTSKGLDHSVENFWLLVVHILMKKFIIFWDFVYTDDSKLVHYLLNSTFFHLHWLNLSLDICQNGLPGTSFFFILSYCLKHFLKLCEKII